MPTRVSEFIRGETYFYTVVHLCKPGHASPAHRKTFWETFESKVESFLVNECFVTHESPVAVTYLQISDPHLLARITSLLDDNGLTNGVLPADDVRMYVTTNDDPTALQTDQLFFVLKKDGNLQVCEVAINASAVGESALRITPWDWRAAILNDEDIQEWFDFSFVPIMNDVSDVSTADYDPWVAQAEEEDEQEVELREQQPYAVRGP